MKLGLLLACVLVASPAFAQVSPDKIATIAKAVHDAEGWELGSASSRDTRNEFWARVMGIIHWGHPVYNPTPDASWCLKDGGGGRPQSDDVAAKCQSREFWDCIGGVGADGYKDKFQCNGHGSDRLPAVQNIYPPPKPAGGGPGSGGGGPISAPPQPAPAPVNLQPILDALATLTAKVDAIAAMADRAGNEAEAAKVAAQSAEHDARELNARPVPVLAVPCLSGRVPKPFGGSSEVTFCPVAQ